MRLFPVVEHVSFIHPSIHRWASLPPWGGGEDGPGRQGIGRNILASWPRSPGDERIFILLVCLAGFLDAFAEVFGPGKDVSGPKGARG